MLVLHWFPAPDSTRNRRYNQEDKEDEKEDFSDTGSCAGNTAKAENGRYDRDNEEGEWPW